jgi:hypothetical protein
MKNVEARDAVGDSRRNEQRATSNEQRATSNEQLAALVRSEEIL